jgi:dTDP-4-dehydrorhamnose reductase
MGFANYCVNQILSADAKFRNDSTYLFFLLLVKELVMLKRCKTTYLRQATRIPNLTKDDVLNFKHENLSRFNRSFEVFKNMRGTSMYYEESKKNLMALLRQNGCPTLFFTLSCAEFDWADLLKEIIETVYKKEVSNQQIEELSTAEKNRIISENYVQSTLHFQKRIEKIFTLMKYEVEENLSNLSETHQFDVLDEILDELSNPNEEQTILLSSKANKQVKRTMKKMEKIAVAPGEFGSFKNRGEDIFLEEKIFPERFPYGTGGYLSSCIFLCLGCLFRDN